MIYSYVGNAAAAWLNLVVLINKK